jgi:hypothetical protein
MDILSLTLVIALVGSLALIPLGLRSGDRPHDVVLNAVEPQTEPRGAAVTLANRDGIPVIVGLTLRRAGVRLRLEGAGYVTVGSRRRRAEERDTVAVLDAGETATIIVPAGARIGARAELVVVIGQRERLRTIHRLVRLPGSGAARGVQPGNPRSREPVGTAAP